MNLEQEIKEVIVERLGIEMNPEEINLKFPLFGVDDEGNGLNLDSVDALELVVGINEHFNITHQSDDLSTLYSVETIMNYINEETGVKNG